MDAGSRRSSAGSVIGTFTLVAALALGAVVAAVAPATAGGSGLRRLPDRGWRVDGTVYATKLVRDTVYVAGSFDQVVSPRGKAWPRHNLAAIHMRSGRPVRGWHPNPDDVVKSLAVAGKWLYVGGHFHTIGGVRQPHLARINRASGAVARAFSPVLRSPARALTVYHGGLYVGGFFASVNDAPAAGLVRLDPASGRRDGRFTASVAGGGVYALAVDRRRAQLYVGGQFDHVDGQPRQGMAQVDAATGALSPHVFSGAINPTYAVAVGAGRVYGGVGQDVESVYAWRLGNAHRDWRVQANGDIQAIAYYRKRVYLGFHAGYRGNTHLKALSADARTGRVLRAFRPRIDAFWGVRAISVGAEGLVLGGSFRRVSGVRTGHMARFLRR